MKSVGIELPDGQVIKSFQEGRSYKYLGILDADKFLEQKIKLNVSKEYIWKLRTVLKSKLNGRNLVCGVNTLAVSVLRYSATFVSWRKSELQDIFMEPVFIELLIRNKINHLLGVIFLSTSLWIIISFTTILWTLLNNFLIENKPSVISGDFKPNLINYTQNRPVNPFLENIWSNNFISHVTLPTRITKKSVALIDHIFTNNEHNLLAVECFPSTYNISEGIQVSN